MATPPLDDSDLRLHVIERLPAGNPIWGVPSIRFEPRLGDIGVGHLNLRISDAPRIHKFTGHIGYGIKPEWRGRRLAERACRLVLPIARAEGMRTVWITCNPDNIASIRTLENLGAVYVDTLDLTPDYAAWARGDRQKRRYRIDL